MSARRMTGRQYYESLDVPGFPWGRLSLAMQNEYRLAAVQWSLDRAEEDIAALLERLAAYENVPVDLCKALGHDPDLSDATLCGRCEKPIDPVAESK